MNMKSLHSAAKHERWLDFVSHLARAGHLTIDTFASRALALWGSYSSHLQ